MKNYSLLIWCAVLCCTTLFAQSKKENVARHWLANQNNGLNIQKNHTLELKFSKPGLSGETFRFYQTMNGVQVLNAEVTIHVSNKDKVSYFASSYNPNINEINTTAKLSKFNALNLALGTLNVKEADLTNYKQGLFVLNKNNETFLVHRILVSSYNKVGDWEVMVNALTGAVISTTDVAHYYRDNNDHKKKKSTAVKTTGRAMVYLTDPLTDTNSVYGGEFVDGNDATTPALDAARTPVVLLDIELKDGKYKLKGDYVEIAELSSPNKSLFIQSSPNFSFTRNQNGFEAVNAYYHLDKNLRYVNEELGIKLVPTQNNGVLQFDPHALKGNDQSQYKNGTVLFGEGCVDDAEDSDVILHELAHGLHDWATNGSMSLIEGVTEGSGDYWAMSHKRSIGSWTKNDPAKAWIFTWDGHNTCWEGRIIDCELTYPDGLEGGSGHMDGQMWSTTLMEIWEDIGKTKTDKAFLEGLAMTNTQSTQQDAAIAVRQAAIDMGEAEGFTCEDIEAITSRFTSRGYILPSVNCSTLSVKDYAVTAISLYPNPTRGRITIKNVKEAHTIGIYNMLGQELQRQEVNNNLNVLDVSNFATGTYFIKFMEVGTILKFIKE